MVKTIKIVKMSRQYDKISVPEENFNVVQGLFMK